MGDLIKPRRQQRSMQDLWQDSYLSGDNTAYLEKLEEAPFESHLSLHAQQSQEKVIDLIAAYRSVGHLQAAIDPLGLYRGIDNPILKLEYYGFTEEDLNTVFDVGSFGGLQKSSASLREIDEALRRVYCGSIGIEYMHILQQTEVSWIQKRMEQDWSRFTPTSEQKHRILDCLIVADGLEKYLGFKYVGQKRFSLEGGDSLIPMLDELIKRGAESGIKEIVVGMAHRGRMNVLVNLLGKEPEKIFAGFEGKGIDESSSGDVKYHLGFSSNIKTNGSQVHLALAFNPSHLEIVSPVVQGSVRSRQRRRKDIDRSLVMPIQIHGDAAFAGQGVVMETFAMSQARWFWVGGSIHIVINNQVGFTISNPEDSRSGLYCTDIAKMVQAPILHVNGNDPEAVFFAAQLAADYRNLFKKDIVIDMVCYRRHGHNETDEPAATQPLMYKIIKSMPAPCTLYANQLISEGVIGSDIEQQKADAYRQKLDEGKSVVELVPNGDGYEYSTSWEPFLNKDWTAPAKTAVSLSKIKEIASKIEALPENFIVQPQVKKMLEARQKMTEGELPLNWGYTETLAYATLLEEGYPIRLCGQDACRGTFAHRHAVLHDQNTDEIYIPLSHISTKQAQINLVDSLLSEEAVLAFEYGYASAEPNNLVIWEAQFGDFANGAQVVIDQFISSGEQKWGRLCGLVLLLPHGYEGQGPEHSSARLERYLQLCAEQNMQVCVPSTPAQIFHLLRRQMLRPYRKPLIVITPKSLLRAELAVSSLEDISEGEFKLVIPDSDIASKDLKKSKKIDKIDKIDRVVLCSGKVYYDLLKKRREQKLNTTAIIRIEQLYPFPTDTLKEILKPYQHVKTIIWCQEEPMNQGAWYSTQHHLQACLESTQILRYAGRAAAAAPAVGYASVHIKQQEILVNQALGLI